MTCVAHLIFEKYVVRCASDFEKHVVRCASDVRNMFGALRVRILKQAARCVSDFLKKTKRCVAHLISDGALRA